MSTGDRQFRLVVQSVSANTTAPVYRVILYPERERLRTPLTFSSRGELLQRLTSAIPDFDPEKLREPGGSTRILFAETLELTDAQLAKLFGA
jgi:hypothetical protein